ncbi:MAG: PH domain-containing protein [Sphingomonadales bacterium]|nr:PH domain-containing protein [Sphingomonadales bacterium]
MKATPPAAADAAEPPERLHPAYFLTGLGQAAKGSFGVLAAGAYFSLSGRWLLLGLMVVAYIVITLVGLWLRWLRFSYRLSDEGIVIESGLISTQHRSIPFARIQDVNIEQGPIARLIGVARVKLETGASAGKGGDDGVLEAIGLDRANRLRDTIRAYRGGGAIAAVGADGAVASPTSEAGDQSLFAMAPARVLRSGVYNFSLAIFAAIGGLFQFGGDMFGIDPFKRLFWNQLLDAGSPLAQLILSHRWISAVAGLLTLIAVGVATGVVTTILRDWNFRLTRTETGLRRQRGLLTLTDVIIPVRRVQAAIIGTGPIRARSGWHSLKLQSLARDEARQGDHEVAPFAQLDEIAPILAEAGMALPAPDTRWLRIDSAYAIEFSCWLALPIAITLTVAAVGVWPALIGTGALAIAIAGRWLAWRRYRYASDGERVLIRRGFWRQRLIVLPIGNIQSIDVARNFVDRALGVSSVTFGVAGGSGFATHEVAALPSAKAYALREDLLQRFA